MPGIVTDPGVPEGRPARGYDRRVARTLTLRELVAELVAIDSVNPDLVPGGAGELEIARFVAALARARRASRRASRRSRPAAPT